MINEPLLFWSEMKVRKPLSDRVKSKLYKKMDRLRSSLGEPSATLNQENYRLLYRFEMILMITTDPFLNPPVLYKRPFRRLVLKNV